MTCQPEAIPSLLAARHGTTHDALVAAGLDPARIDSVQDEERARKEAGARVYSTIRWPGWPSASGAGECLLTPEREQTITPRE